MRRVTTHELVNEFVTTYNISSKAVGNVKGVPYVKRRYVKKDMLDYPEGTYLKKTKVDKSDSESEITLSFGDKLYEAKTYNKYHKFGVRGYVITDIGVMELRKRLPVVSPILTAIAVILSSSLVAYGVYYESMSSNTKITPFAPPPPVGDFEDWDGEYNKNPEPEVEVSEQETITVPGFMNLVCDAEHTDVKLFNYEDNTVNLVYTIIQERTSEVYKVFGSEKDAATFVASQSSVREGNVISSYVVKGNTVEYAMYEILCETDQIPPGKQTTWNAFESLKGNPGENIVNISISTYDVVTGEQCYGSTQDVTITVK